MNRKLVIAVVALFSAVAFSPVFAADIDIKIPLPPAPKFKIPKPPAPKVTVEAPRPRVEVRKEPARDRNRRHSPRRYEYYPDAEAYFDPLRGLFFFIQGNQWVSRSSLPPDIKVRIGNKVELELDDDLPYYYHDDVLRRYPRHRRDYNQGYNDGYSEGYESGYKDAYNEGYKNAYNEAYRDGYRAGYRAGERNDDRDRGRRGWERRDR